MNRDPHLPPPGVCDWLLEKDWSDERVVEQRVTTMAGRLLESGTLIGSSLALVAIGANETGHFELPVEALEVLRADREARREAIERKRAAMEPDELERKRQREEDRVDDEDSELKLLRKILAKAEKAEHSAIATIGVFTTAAVIMASQAFNLAYQPNEAEEAQREADDPGPDQPLPRGGIVLNSEDTGSLLLEAIVTLRDIANPEQGGANGLSWCRSKASAMLDRVQQVGEARP